MEDAESETGWKAFPRLKYTGIFSDPNDLSMIAVIGSIICCFGFTERRSAIARTLLLLLIPLFVTTLILTKSRGGLLALIAGLGALSAQRIGFRKSLLAGIVLVPVGLALIGGRQADLGTAISGGTGKSRTELWSEGLQLFRQAPLFGIGKGEYDEEVGQVAHNSFLHCFTELGLFGGAFFLGAFWFALWGLFAAGAKGGLHYHFTRDESLRKMQAPLLAMGAARYRPGACPP
jgi:O-antigen ligase